MPFNFIQPPRNMVLNVIYFYPPTHPSTQEHGSKSHLLYFHAPTHPCIQEHGSKCHLLSSTNPSIHPGTSCFPKAHPFRRYILLIVLFSALINVRNSKTIFYSDLFWFFPIVCDNHIFIFLCEIDPPLNIYFIANSNWNFENSCNYTYLILTLYLKWSFYLSIYIFIQRYWKK